MFGSLSAALTRFGRWPRRIAALGCLLLAGGTALARPAQPAVPRAGARPISAALRPGEVAVPVALDAAHSSGYQLRPGDRIGLMTTADDTITGDAVRSALVADRLRVLRTSTPDDSSADTGETVLVAADRPTALRIADAGANPLLAVLDDRR